MKITLDKIISDSQSICDQLNEELYKTSYNDWVLLIARGAKVLHLERIGRSPYVVDDYIDKYWDSTREDFYTRYLEKYYSKPGYHYTDKDGIYNLHIELMIYSHVWESSYYLKLLKQISNILTGKGYNWDLTAPKENIKNFIKTEIIKPLTTIKHPFGQYLTDIYSPNLRNSFAHSLYNIDIEKNIISFHHLSLDEDDEVKDQISIDAFQEKFLKSTILSYFLINTIELNRIYTAKFAQGHAITEPFLLPNKQLTQLIAGRKIINGNSFPYFQPILINPALQKFEIGDLVSFEDSNICLKVINIKYIQDEQIVLLDRAKKYCLSAILNKSTDTEYKPEDSIKILHFLD